MANQILAIAPYWLDSVETWVFDDEAVDLVQEPFVSGVPEMIDELVADFPNAKNGFRMLFSAADQPVVFGTKGNFGHTLGSTGAIEAIALVLALRSGQVPPVVDLEEPDPEFPLPLPSGHSVECPGRIGLTLTLGFGGFDTSLVFEACS